MWPNQLASSVRPFFVEASPTVEKTVSCYKADRLVALLLSFHSVQFACVTRISCCRGGTLRTRPQTGLCEPDVMAPKAHQNNRSYVSSVDLPSDSLHKNLAWWVITRNCENWGWMLARVSVLARDNTVYVLCVNSCIEGYEDLASFPSSTQFFITCTMVNN